MRTSWLTLAALGLGVGCDDTVFPTGETVEGEGYDAVIAVFEGNCTSCHSEASASSFGNLALDGDPCEQVVGVESSAYDGVLVVAGDSQSSVLWHKIADTGEYGGVMPSGSQMAQENIDIVANWIDDDAVTDCEVAR